MARAGEIDLAIVTNCGEGQVEVVRQEPLLWVASQPHGVEDEEILPLALSKAPCMWRTAALDALPRIGRKYRVLYTSGNSTAISAAVQAGLAVTVLAESALRPGMRVLSEADGFPRLPNCEIGIIRSWHRPDLGDRRQARRAHRSSLDNLSVRRRRRGLSLAEGMPCHSCAGRLADCFSAWRRVFRSGSAAGMPA